MNKKSLAIDLDGTIIDVSKRDYGIYCDLVTILKGQPLEFSLYWELRRNQTDIHYILELSKITNQISIDYFLKKRKEFMEMDKYLMLDSLIPGASSTLDMLSSKYNVFILTIRHNIVNTNIQLNRLGLSCYNTIIVSGHKETELLAIPNIMAMVGDTENDICAAQKVGIKSIAVLTGIRNREKLESLHPNMIIDSISDMISIE